MPTRVLIADDELAVRDVLARSLGHWGYEVVIAANGQEAWNILQREDAPRLAVLDWAMPGVDGLELCKRIRQLKRADYTFVLVLTAHASKDDQLTALEAGADDVMTKPFNLRELEMRLAAGVRGRRISARSLPAPAPVPLSIRSSGESTLAGQILAGKYLVERMIGKGGMGTIWEGAHLTLGVKVAIKFINSEYALEPNARARFELEARSTARLRTAHAVHVFDYGVTDCGLPYLVLEHLRGRSLMDVALHGEPLSLQETTALVVQAAQALGHAHSLGIVHRDVKPDNILLVEDADMEPSRFGYRVKIIDFGVAKVLVQSECDAYDFGAHGAANANDGATNAGTLIGTPNFMTPEQLRGTAGASPASDLWGLAASAFTAITGHIPFEGSTLDQVIPRVCSEPLPVPSEYNPDVPPEFDAWFAKACARDPNDRFQSAYDLASALLKACGEYDATRDVEPWSMAMVTRQRRMSASRLRVGSTINTLDEFADVAIVG